MGPSGLLPERGIPMRGSTVKSGFQKANSLAFCRLNALSSAKGPGFREANSLARLAVTQWLTPSKSAPADLCFMASGGLFLEQGNPIRQKRQERFWTASAGREAANPMDGVSN